MLPLLSLRRFGRSRSGGRRALPAIILGGLLALHGCGDPNYPAAKAPAGEMTGGSAPVAGKTAEASPSSEPETGAPPAALPRKIIYTAEVELGTDDLAKTEKRLLQLVKDHRGYIASSDMSGAPGTPRTGSWKVRVPVERFDAFMAEVTRIAELRRTRSDSQDVSAEYYDLEARLRNKRVEERRLVQHLERSTARLTDILAVEKELSRVREEIEQMEGRRRFLTNQTDLTTVSVSISEVHDYIPAERAPFGKQITRTFGDSLNTMGEAVRGITLVAVWLAPWLLAGAVVLVPMILILRRLGGPRKSPPGG